MWSAPSSFHRPEWFITQPERSEASRQSSKEREGRPKDALHAHSSTAEKRRIQEAVFQFRWRSLTRRSSITRRGMNAEKRGPLAPVRTATTKGRTLYETRALKGHFCCNKTQTKCPPSETPQRWVFPYFHRDTFNAAFRQGTIEVLPAVS